MSACHTLYHIHVNLIYSPGHYCRSLFLEIQLNVSCRMMVQTCSLQVFLAVASLVLSTSPMF